MSLSYKKRLVLEKTESAYGTDAAPGAADALLTVGLTANPIAGSYIARDLVDGHEGAQPEIHTNRHASVETVVEATASGSAGTPPPYGAMLMSCGFAEVTDPGTSVAYSPVSSGYSSSTLVTHMGGASGHRQVITGARGSLSFAAERGQVPRFTATRLGIYAAPTDAAPPAVDYTAFKTPLTVEPAHMDAFTRDGTTLCFRSFQFSDGRSPVVDKFANCGGVDISARAFTGSMVVEFPTITARDMLTESLAGVLQPMVWRIGKTAGAMIEISAPAVQIKFTGYQDVENTLAAAFDLTFTHTSAGDDEVLITYR